MLLRVTVKSRGDFLPALKNYVLLMKTPTDILLFNSCASHDVPVDSRYDPVSLSKVCFFWNGSYSTFHFLMLRIFVMRTGIFLDKSFLFRFSILMGSYLPCKKSPFGHLSGKVILLMGGDCLSHVITVVGVELINIAIF